MYKRRLIAWTAIGARTSESQTHREMASGLSTPVGFKNATDGDLEVAINAILSAGSPHSFLGINSQGQSAVTRTRGNRYGHVILRGGKQPNYSAADIAATCALLQSAGLRAQVMVDVSHANSSKEYERQIGVAQDVAGQVAAGDSRIIGLMVESHLQAGRQDIVAGKPLAPGVSVTDACISMEQTIPVLQELAAAVRTRRAR